MGVMSCVLGVTEEAAAESVLHDFVRCGASSHEQQVKSALDRISGSGLKAQSFLQ